MGSVKKQMLKDIASRKANKENLIVSFEGKQNSGMSNIGLLLGTVAMKKNKDLTKDQMRERLKTIAKMLDCEYKLDALKSTRAIYRAVAELHNDVKDCEK